MVAEGVKALSSSDYPMLGGLSVAEMARRVGVTERTGYAKWDAEDFQVAVIRALLGPDEPPGERLDPDQMVEFGRKLVDDERVAPLDDLTEVFTVMWQAVSTDPETRITHALWAYCDADSRVAEQIQASIGHRYDRWLRETQTVLDAFLAQQSRRVSVRNDLTRADMAMLAVILAEGSAFHARLRKLLGREPFAEDLPGRAFKALLASALVYHEDDGAHPVDRYLERILEPPSEPSGTDPGPAHADDHPDEAEQRL
jgi:hypothetical protein